MKTQKIVLRLSYLIILLTLLAVGAGIFWQGEGEPYPFTTLRGETVQIYGHGLYRYDTVSYAAQAIGQDCATLIIGIPLLILGVYLVRKDSLRGQLLLTGGLGYILYTYTSYSFLSAYNPLFLVYVTLFSLSLFGFIFAMVGLNADEVSRKVSGKMPRRGIAIFLMVIASFLAFAWLGRIIPSLMAGTPPFGLEAYTTLVIQALDLGIIVPMSVITAVLLWQKHPWGYTLASVLLVKALMMGAALVAMIIGLIWVGAVVSPVEIVMFFAIALSALIFTIIQFGSIEEKTFPGEL